VITRSGAAPISVSATGWVALAAVVIALRGVSTAVVSETAGVALVAALRCFTEPVSDASLLFDLEDLVDRGLDVSADAAISDTAAVSSASLRVFFEGLLNNMQNIKTHRNIFCSNCL
jgi:hypothetical protein